MCKSNEQNFNWLLFQRLSIFLYMAVGILLLIYALGFVSNVYIFYAYGGKGLVDFYHEMQILNKGLLWKAIAAVCFSFVLLLLELGKHPAGIITLVVTVIITSVSIFFSVDSLAALADARLLYSDLDFNSLNRYIERGAIKYEYSTLTFDLGLAGYSLFLLTSLCMIFTVIRNAFTVKSTEGGIK